MLRTLFRGRYLRLLLLSAVLTFITLIYRSQLLEHYAHTTLDDHSFLSTSSLVTDANGFLSLRDAEPYCHKHSWSPYPKRDARRKVYDLFMVSGELDWLEIRLHELQDQVDYFVIVESATTFTGIPKPLYLKEHWDMLQPFHKKIIYHVLEKSPTFNSTRTWDHEDLQRNAMFDQVFPKLQGEEKPSMGDVIIVSDVDEIPRPEALTIMRNCDYSRRLTLRSRFYYYSFQWLHRGEEWAHPQATYYEGEDTIRPANLRNGEGGSNALLRKLEKADLHNAAWHCSSCFATVEEMLTKMSSFSHTTLNRPEFRETSGLVRRVRNGLDLFDRPTEFYDRVEKNEDIPRYLKTNQEKFTYMLDRDPTNANFRDYSPSGS